MNIKSLLLGSAAALAVVSGAQAADAVVAAEPEPMEYVKVCDAYGTGYFYIPGTETCLKVGGELRYEKRVGRVGDGFTAYDNHSRVKLEVSAKNDSEWGTVYSWIRIQGDMVQGADDRKTKAVYEGAYSKGVDFYYIFGIGGLEFSNFDSQWAKFFGYGGFTDDGGVYDTDWNHPNSRQYISYTADFGSAKVYVSLDNDLGEWTSYDRLTGVYTEFGRKGNHKYMPDVTAGATASFGDWQVAGGVAYDESDESFALKGLVAGNFGMFGVRFMPLYSNSDLNEFFQYKGFSAIVGLQAKVTDTVTISKDIQWWDDGSWRLVGDVNWQVASGFSVLLEGTYANPDKGSNVKTGMLRFQRNF